MAKTCKEFVEAYKSEYINCFTCRHWDREDFACNEPGELAKRNKVREFNAFDKQMKRNKSVIGPL
ncbi:MAG: hypothetical protein Q8911_00415 [Bacillota bacterium]|nr:hypothetical protein [Bacillota bacterium]